jgi:hypothetical protein
LLVTLVPWFRNVVMKLIPPDVDLKVRVAVGLAYYSFWAALFGVAVGGSLSAGCAAPATYDGATTDTKNADAKAAKETPKTN